MKKIKKIAVMTSGGDAPGMNAAIRSVVRTCAYYHTECMGIYRGYQGLIEGDLVPLSARSVNNIINKDQQAILKPSNSMAHCKLKPSLICNAATKLLLKVTKVQKSTQRASRLLLRAAIMSNANKV